MSCPFRKKFLQIVALLYFYNTASAQFAPATDLSGTTAIWRDSSVFVEWASGCVIQRGPMNIANPSLGLASAGDSTKAIGAADDGVVSLGDGGSATLTFNHAVYNGDGADFAVFENGFMTNDSNMAFLELAFVEVSTDGIRYIRFPAITHVQDTAQLGNDGSMDCSQMYNLAGKYIAGYGTPFDLQELIDSPGIDINNINYVKVIDVVGSIDSVYGTRDHYGNMVNDPWPTPFASCGFDLDAIGVIHAKGISEILTIVEGSVKIYPNPVHQDNIFRVELPENSFSIRLFDISGQLLNQWPATDFRQDISTAHLSSGLYFVTAETATAHFNTKLIVE